MTTRIADHGHPRRWTDNAIRLIEADADSYFSDDWLAQQGLDPTGAAAVLTEFERSGRFPSA